MFTYASTPNGSSTAIPDLSTDLLVDLVHQFGADAVDRAVRGAARANQLHDLELLRRLCYLYRQIIDMEREAA